MLPGGVIAFAGGALNSSPQALNAYVSFVEIEMAFRHDRFRHALIGLASPNGTVSEP